MGHPTFFSVNTRKTMDYLANEKWATRHDMPGTSAALAASTVRNIGGNRAGTGIAEKMDIEAFVSGVVD